MNGTELKSIAKYISDGYDNTVHHYKNILKEKSKAIDSTYYSNVNTIKKKSNEAKNNASVSSQIALNNSRNALVSKGLSKSGESAYAELLNGIARSGAFTSIDNNAIDEIAESGRKRAEQKAQAYEEYESNVAKTKKEETDRVSGQLNEDNNFALAKEKEANAKEKWQKELDAEKDKNEKNYTLQKEKNDNDARYKSNLISLKASEANSKAKENEEKDRRKNPSTATPQRTPKQLVDDIVGYAINFQDDLNEEPWDYVREQISSILSSRTISDEYRADLIAYCKSLGIIK